MNSSVNFLIFYEEYISILKVQSKLKCGTECVKINCYGFAFQQQPPDVGTCTMTMGFNVTKQPLEGSEYYIKLRKEPWMLPEIVVEN